MEHEIRIEYRNVIVRPLKHEDIGLLRKWRNNPGNTKYLSKIGYITEKQQNEWYNRYLVNEDEYIFAIEENRELNRIVGSASLYNFINNQVEFGKILIGDEEAHGKKIGFNSIIAMLGIAFERFNCESVVLRCFTDNKVACRVYEQSGFVEVKRYMIQDGKEEVLMQITKESFKNRRKIDV